MAKNNKVIWIVGIVVVALVFISLNQNKPASTFQYSTNNLFKFNGAGLFAISDDCNSTCCTASDGMVTCCNEGRVMCDGICLPQAICDNSRNGLCREASDGMVTCCMEAGQTFCGTTDYCGVPDNSWCKNFISNKEKSCIPGEDWCCNDEGWVLDYTQRQCCPPNNPFYLTEGTLHGCYNQTVVGADNYYTRTNECPGAGVMLNLDTGNICSCTNTAPYVYKWAGDCGYSNTTMPNCWETDSSALPGDEGQDNIDWPPGNQPTIKGITFGTDGLEIDDNCLNSTHLWEYYCYFGLSDYPRGVVASKKVDCRVFSNLGLGQCINGECAAISTVIPTNISNGTGLTLVNCTAKGLCTSSNGGCISCPINPTCTDKIKDGTETGVDCGGSCKACSSGGGSDINKSEENDTVVCTMLAKKCSDGSYVSQNASNSCEYNACPEAPFNYLGIVFVAGIVGLVIFIIYKRKKK